MESLENRRNSDVKFEEMTPLFSSALASNVSAMRIFALADNEKRREILNNAAQIKTKKEMRNFLKGIY